MNATIRSFAPSRRFLALALAVPLFAGCSLARLKPEAATIEALGLIAGRAVDPAPGAPIVAVLLAGGEALRVVTYDLASAEGRFVFVAAPGPYEVVAFADGDGDFVRDDGEPAARRRIEVQTTPRGEPPQQVAELRLAADTPSPALDLSAFGATADGPARNNRIGEVVSLDDPRFAPDVISSGLWEPLRFAAESGMRLFLLEPYDPGRIPVVLVHGMLGSPRDFATIVANLDRTRFQPWVAYYPSGLSLDLTALFLAEALEEARLRLGVERVHVVAHSMGGLVSRAALELRLRRGRAPLVGEYVTLSTPWRGSEGVRGQNFGIATAPVVAPSWRDMLPASEFLGRVAERPLPPDVRHTLIFGFAGGSRLIAGADDGSVALASMLPWEIVRRAQHILGFEVDHEGILTDPRVLDVLTRVLRGEAPTAGAGQR